ncbi:transmembrane anchor protein [Pseudomonas sp. 2FE]|uniref:transmembrane anchor protein n=1 Tax=Pseudomonas sp. 2FE TaxID=2502190 RepID=UPI0010F748BA|nr:transmembrane anchor protein [Pseudomonas sp. 2FE]
MFNTPLPTLNELPSSRQLLRSTAIALITAIALLVTVVMPSEYAIDPTGAGRVLGLTQMGELKITLAQEAAADAAVSPPGATTPAQAPAQEAPQVQVAARPAAESVSEPKPALKTDEMTVTLKPGEAREIKLDMLNNAKVSYEWSTTGGPVNHDTHGEPYNGAEGYFHSYRKGQQVTGDKGEFTAIFDGTHGWFWRNRSNGDVTITLKTTGEYLNVKRLI